MNDKRASPAARARGIFFAKKSTTGRKNKARSKDRKIMNAREGISQNIESTKAIDTTIKKEARYVLKFMNNPFQGRDEVI